jgi:hypothetical protein
MFVRLHCSFPKFLTLTVVMIHTFTNGSGSKEQDDDLTVVLLSTGKRVTAVKPQQIMGVYGAITESSSSRGEIFDCRVAVFDVSIVQVPRDGWDDS